MADEATAGAPVAWHELNTSDAAAGRAFYTEVLGWGIEAFPMPGSPEMGEYTMFTSGGKPFAGISPMSTSDTGAPPHWAVFFNVEDVDAAAARTVELGGAVVVPAFEVPTVGRMSLVHDPQGSHFWLFKGVPQP